MNPRFVSQLVLAAAATLLAPVAFADVLYKLIDKNGKVTYSEEKPKAFDGQVIRLDINPQANTMPPPASGTNSGEPTSPSRRPAQGNPKKPSPEERIATARERLEVAQKALQDARDNPADSDLQTIGTQGGIKKGGGTRTVPSAGYQAKLDQLEKAVKDAEEALQDAERGV
jgi:Domain of unknown function (DUF4124)